MSGKTNELPAPVSPAFDFAPAAATTPSATITVRQRAVSPLVLIFTRSFSFAQGVMTLAPPVCPRPYGHRAESE